MSKIPWGPRLEEGRGFFGMGFGGMLLLALALNGLAFLGLASLVMASLKLLGYTGSSWWAVSAPLWAGIPALAALAGLAAAALRLLKPRMMRPED